MAFKVLNNISLRFYELRELIHRYQKQNAKTRFCSHGWSVPVRLSSCIICQQVFLNQGAGFKGTWSALRPCMACWSASRSELWRPYVENINQPRPVSANLHLCILITIHTPSLLASIVSLYSFFDYLCTTFSRVSQTVPHKFTSSVIYIPYKLFLVKNISRTFYVSHFINRFDRSPVFL